jgi:hypothetical protein
MGYAISWLAIRGSSEPAVLAALGLEKTGETEDVPESNWCSTRVGEWILIWCNSFEPARFVDAASRIKGEAVICDVEEHVMFVSATAFVGGVPNWRIVHDAQQAHDHLTVEGKPRSHSPEYKQRNWRERAKTVRSTLCSRFRSGWHKT